MNLPGNLRVLSCLAVQRRLGYFLPMVSRAFSQDAKTTKVATDLGETKQTSIPNKGKIGLTDHKVNRLEKFFLVWGGKYKSVADVPDLVSQSTLERARNKARIKVNLMMCAVTLFACLAMIYSGKRAKASGESVVKMNEDWHKSVKEAEFAKQELESAKSV